MRDFFDELGEVALGSRLKRLGDRMMTSAGGIYQHFGCDMQPRWFSLLALLHRKQQMSVVEAAQSLGLSQPAVSQFSSQLISHGWVQWIACPNDGRRKLLQLTDKGLKQVEDMLPVWRAVEKAARNLCTALDNDFYPALVKLESALAQKSLLQRTLEAYDDAKD